MPGLQTFPRHERLRTGSEYREVYRRGEKCVGRGFICYVAHLEAPGRKFGMAVSRKVGNAVVRNRVKRFIRETYRAHRFEVKDDVTVVIIARPSASTMTFAECGEAIGRLFRTGGALNA